MTSAFRRLAGKLFRASASICKRPKHSLAAIGQFFRSFPTLSSSPQNTIQSRFIGPSEESTDSAQSSSYLFRNPRLRKDQTIDSLSYTPQLDSRRETIEASHIYCLEGLNEGELSDYSDDDPLDDASNAFSKNIPSALGFGNVYLMQLKKEHQRRPVRSKLFKSIKDVFNLQKTHETLIEQVAKEQNFTVSYELNHNSSVEQEEQDKQANSSEDKLVINKDDLVSGEWENALLSFLKKRPDFQTLRLQGMDIGEKEARILAKHIKNQPKLSNVIFCDNSIGVYQSLKVVVTFLLQNSNVKNVSIVRNSITDRDIPHIIALMTQHTSLSRVDLCWNGIGNDGARQLAKLLSNTHNTNITELDLSYNKVGREGLSYFSSLRDKININIQRNETYNEFRIAMQQPCRVRV